jgi:hypothetical protein
MGSFDPNGLRGHEVRLHDVHYKSRRAGQAAVANESRISAKQGHAIGIAASLSCLIATAGEST